MLSKDYLRLSREELYQLVWSKPMQHLAKDYGVSDRAVAKACARKQVPVPSRGYWAKKLAGVSVDMPSLPEFINKAPKKESETKLDNASKKYDGQSTDKIATKGRTKIRNAFDDRDKDIKNKLREFRRSLSEDVYYVARIDHWDCDYTFGLNSHYNPLRKHDTISFMYDEPHKEYRSLSIKGVFLKPSQLKGQIIEAGFWPTTYLNETIRKENIQHYEENPPSSVGTLQKQNESIWGIISLPADSMNLVVQTIMANKIKFVTLHAGKLRYGHAEVHRYSLQEKYEEE